MRNGKLVVVELPNFGEAMNMSHKNLIFILRYCPLSNFFGVTKEILNMQNLPLTKARKYVLELSLKKYPGQHLPIIEEKGSHSEGGSIASGGSSQNSNRAAAHHE